jgi:hypothetical protein
MGKSKKKAILKDAGYKKDIYWQVHRRTNKQILKNAVEIGSDEIAFKQPKELIDDYDYSDYIIDYEYIDNESPNDIANQIKYRRK